MRIENENSADRYPFSDFKRLTIMISKLIRGSGVGEQVDEKKGDSYCAEFRELSSKIVESYGGVSRDIDDDKIVSIFGFYSMREDDPIIAVKAAMDIRKMIDGLSDKYKLSPQSDCNVVTCINSEFTTLSNYGKPDQYSDSLKSLANDTLSQCESADEEGVVVGNNIYKSVSRYYDLEEIVLGSAKGKGPFFRIIGERSQPQRIHRTMGFCSEFIGRRDELELLMNGVEELKNGSGGIIEVIGEAGVGKTRLINEFRNRSDLRGVQWIEGYCFSYFVNYPFILFSNLISKIFSISGQDSKEAIKTKIKALTEKIVDEPDEVIPYISSLYSIKYDMLEGMAPATFKLNFFESIYKLLIAYSKNQPLVIVFEDLQWADLSSIDLIRYLFYKIEDFPSILFVCTYRSDFSILTVRQSLYRDVRNKQVNLKPLPSEESKRMLESILKTPQLPQKLVKFVTTTGEGNPFYIEEIINSLVESGRLFRDGEEWVASEEISDFSQSVGVKGLVLSRLDQLDAGSKRILCEASVIGRLFKSSVLKNIASMPDKVDDLLRHLESSDYIQSVGFDEDEEFIFKHTIIHDIAYNSIPLETRKSLHGQIGKYYEYLYSENIDLHLDLVTYHYSESDQHNKAIYYCVTAGDKSYRNASLYEAGKYYLKAVEFIKSAPDRENLEDTLLVSLQRIFDCLKMTDPAVVLEHLQLMLDIFEKRDDNFNVLITKGLMISAYAGSNRWREGGRLGEELITSQEEGSLIWAILLIPTAMSVLSLGELEKTFDYAVKSIEVVKGQDPWLLASAYLCAYSSSSWMGNISDALKYTDLSIELCKENKQLIDLEAFSHLYQGFAYLLKGEYELAKESLNRSKEIEEKLGGGYYYIASFRYFVSGLLYYALGDWKNLKIEADELINLQRYINGSLLHYSDIFYAWLKIEADEKEDALRLFQKAVEKFEQLEFKTVLAKIFRSLGELYIEKGRIDEALEAINRGIESAERSNQKTELVALRSIRATVRAERGEWDKAVEELEICDLGAGEMELIPTSARVKEAWGRYYLIKAEKTPNERPSLLKKAVDSYNRSLELWEQVDNPRQVSIMAKGLQKIVDLTK